MVMIAKGTFASQLPGERTEMTSVATWPRRRWAVAVVLLPALAVLFAGATPTLPAASAVPWWLGLVAAASVGAVVLASYLPAAGWRPDLGCTPCAAMSGLTIFAATFAFATFGAEISAPLLATVATGFGLVQRLTRPEVCDTGLGPVDLSWTDESEDGADRRPDPAEAPSGGAGTPRP